MVQVLPEVPSFGQQFARNLSSGVSQGASQLADYYSKLGVEKFKNNQRKKLIESIEGPAQSSTSQLASNRGQNQQKLEQQFLEALPQIEQHIGRELTPQDIDQLWSHAQNNMVQAQNPQSNQQEDPFRKPKQYEALGEHGLANISAKEAEFLQKKESEKASRHHAISDITLKGNAERAEALPQKEAALQNMMDAIKNKDFGFFTKDNLAEITGVEGLRSPEGAVFKTAGKEFFLGSLKRAGARPNQWVEQQISDMLTKIGRSTEANLSVAEALKMETDIERKQIDLTNHIASEMEEKYGYVRRDLSDQVRKQLKPYAEQRQKELQENLMDIKEKYSPVNKEGYLMYDPVGNLRRVDKKEISEAKKAGYRLYK